MSTNRLGSTLCGDSEILFSGISLFHLNNTVIKLTATFLFYGIHVDETKESNIYIYVIAFNLITLKA